jgi:hypothetical protein
MRYAGRCHCGNIEVSFEPAQAGTWTPAVLREGSR